MKKLKYVFVFPIVLGILVIVPRTNLEAQENVLTLEIEVSDILSNSQLLNLTSIGIDSEGRGPVLISGFLQNQTSETLSNLFFDITISASKKGELVYIKSKPNHPFSLAPNQPIYANNNNIASENIPGIKENLVFDVDLTTAGDKLFDNLDGSTTLPADVYVVSVTVFQQTNATGRVDLVTTQAEIGGSAAVAETIDFFLRTPGDEPDAEAEITNPFPQFSWEGDSGVEYRLIVVRNNGSDSPETLLQSARSSAPISEGGSLLQFENLDVLVKGESFQFPASGAQPLEAGQTYYWQISNTIKEGLNTIERSSEIWSFKLAAPETSSAPIVLSGEARTLLIQLVGQSKFETLRNSGFSIQEIEIDGVTYSGNQASVILERILTKIEDGNIILSGNN